MENKNTVSSFYERNDKKQQTEWLKQKWIMWFLFHLFEKFSI